MTQALITTERSGRQCARYLELHSSVDQLLAHLQAIARRVEDLSVADIEGARRYFDVLAKMMWDALLETKGETLA